MAKPIFSVDFNELLEPTLVLLSKEDTKVDSLGSEISLREGLEISVYDDDTNDQGKPDNLVASGVVERNRTTGWGSHVKWCCRIDNMGIRPESEI